MTTIIEDCKAHWHPYPRIPGFWCRRIDHPGRPVGFTAAGPQPEYALIEVPSTGVAAMRSTPKDSVTWRLVAE
jgi:hypothetical protein